MPMLLKHHQHLPQHLLNPKLNQQHHAIRLFQAQQASCHQHLSQTGKQCNYVLLEDGFNLIPYLTVRQGICACMKGSFSSMYMPDYLSACRDAPSRPWDDAPGSPVARNSPFGEGSTLLHEAQVGPIGKFHRALLSLGPTVNLDHFHLPKLICLGNQSTGTTSICVLE